MFEIFIMCLVIRRIRLQLVELVSLATILKLILVMFFNFAKSFGFLGAHSQETHYYKLLVNGLVYSSFNPGDI